ncbi:hypothetical protein, partial [Jeotgalibacillus proteolyticus]|uniref:hypothetical protein n=1 Tax=Jeotgalibacillus proteolyticus TaxID=2082395 RepID=UPI003CF7E94C
PAFVLSQDQTLRKVFDKAHSVSCKSCTNVDVFGCLVFKVQGVSFAPLSQATLLSYHSHDMFVNTFLKFFLIPLNSYPKMRKQKDLHNLLS